MFNILPLDPFFWESRVKGPQASSSLSSWICTEESGCPVGPSWCGRQDPRAAWPSHWYWQLGSWTRHPSSGFLQCKSLSWDLSVFPWSPISPPLGGVTNYSPEGATEQARTATVDFSGLLQLWCPLTAPHHGLSLFCSHGPAPMEEQTAALQRPPRWKPVTLLTVPSCELHF